MTKCVNEVCKTALSDVSLLLEQFSIECRKTKTKVITTANQNKGKYHKEPMRTQSKRM